MGVLSETASVTVTDKTSYVVVMTLPQSGRLDGSEQPQGLPDARAPRLFKVTVFIPAVAIKLLLVAALTAQGLFCTSHHGDRLPSRPEGFAVAMALAPPPTAAPRQSQLSPGGSRRLQPPPLFQGYLISTTLNLKAKP